MFNDKEASNISLKDLKYILASNLTLPTNNQPIYVKNSDGLVVYGSKQPHLLGNKNVRS